MIYPNSSDESTMLEVIKLETNQRRCLELPPTKSDVTGGGMAVFADLSGDTINTEVDEKRKPENMLTF